jgi:hypothetical protein
MRKGLIAPLVLAAALLAPAPASAWGFAAHRFIMDRAIGLLPAELKPFYEKYRDRLLVRVTDPDEWRNVGWDEEPNHFVNFGVPQFGPYPFVALPREYGAAIEKFGTIALQRTGTLPWREAEEFGNMRRTFESFKNNTAYGVDNLVLFSAIAAHYIQDASQPLHATNNYDGQLTGNTGVHSRFERDLLEKFETRLTITPAPARAITNPRDAAFDALLTGFQLVDPIMKADSEASIGKDSYDADYFEKFFTKVKPILERQLAASITASASIIIGAWEQAGKPTPALVGARPVLPIKKPQAR